MYKKTDRLLYVISARSNLPWRKLRDAFDFLYEREAGDSAPGDAINRARIECVRALDSLAHCEFDFSEGGYRVYAAPAMLALLPRPGLPSAVLCGARSRNIEAELRAACRRAGAGVELSVSKQPTRTHLVPARVVVAAGSIDRLALVASESGLSFTSVPPAWELLHVSASLADYTTSLDWTITDELNWQRRDFNHGLQHFAHPGIENVECRYRLSAYTNPVDGQRVHLLWDTTSEKAARVDRDWGRYLLLQETGRNVLHYDSQRACFAAPINMPLPRLMARASALCSGYAPKIVEPRIEPGGGPLRLYQGVPDSVASAIAGLLGQELERVDLVFA